MAYRYDAFFSYKRDPESDLWHKIVKEKLTHWLCHELCRTDVNIFFDTVDIRTGEQWVQRLGDALLSSKCLICIWSPLYFRSKWCVSEWTTFVEREKQTGVNLVVPASYHDGDHFPAVAQEKQISDFSDYTSIMARFWETERAVDFDLKKLKEFASDVAIAIENAPPYAEFPLVEAFDDQVSRDGHIGRLADI